MWACRIHRDTIRTKLTIGKHMLHRMLDKCKTTYETQPYAMKVFRAVLVSMYYGMLRISEVTEGEHVLKARDVHISDNKNKILFILRSSKTHCQADKPQHITISSDEWSSYTIKEEYCPFRIINDFLAVRPTGKNYKEQFFVFQGRIPLTAYILRQIIVKIITELKLNPQSYGSHSFRGGRAESLFKMGVSVETIKKLRWWKSNAVYRYLQ